MTSQWRHYCFGGIDLPEVPLQESVARQQQRIYTQTFTFQQIPIYFHEKSPNLVELFFSLSELWAKNLKGGADHPPGQDRVNLYFRPKF